ncbi:MAG TPA: 2-oxo acid dehydrogenase subunit E2, partial [Gemmatimonadaceae bacterium]
TVVGTGAGGAITRADVVRVAQAAVAPGAIRQSAVEHAVTEPQPPEPSRPTERADGMRHAVAAAVSKSKREIPHYYLSTDIDLSAAFAWLSATNARRPVSERILPAALLLKSVATALRRYPDLNGFWIDGAHRPGEHVHLGIAISLRAGGLIAPAIHDADGLTVDAAMRALTDVVRRARSGGLRGSEMTDATITVSNIGDEGVPVVFGIIYPPQLALVGFGKITERAWAAHGMVGARPVVTATLSADHRATDGHYGARFLAEVDRLLQSPETL